jgi:hypothetical protein
MRSLAKQSILTARARQAVFLTPLIEKGTHTFSVFFCEKVCVPFSKQTGARRRPYLPNPAGAAILVVVLPQHGVGIRGLTRLKSASDVANAEPVVI